MQAFNQAALPGQGTAAQTMLPPGYWAHDGFFTHDPDKARALLAEAGYADGVQLRYYSNVDQSSQQAFLPAAS